MSLRMWLSSLLISSIILVTGITIASAGIGPDGFAQYARQGIINELNHVYGNNNSPYNVVCTDHPSYHPVSDVVVCRITEK